MIALKNPGLLEIDLMTTMGAHVKESESYLGRFGTGMKYAIAVLLRNEIEFDLAIGTNVYEFYTESKTIRGKEFHFCYMRGPSDSIALGFVTDMGQNWEPRQAYRELYTNAVIDEEGGIAYHGPKENSPRPEEGHTMFRIHGAIDTNGVFLREMDKELLFKDERVEIYAGASDHLYYQGVRAKNLNRRSVYTYNIISDCDLTEDRSLCYDFQISRRITSSIVAMGKEHKPLVDKVLNAPEDSFESRLDFSEASYSAKPSETFAEVYHKSPEKQRNSTASSFMTYHIPKAPPTPVTLRREFIQALESIRDDYSITDLKITAETDGQLHVAFEADFFTHQGDNEDD